MKIELFSYDTTFSEQPPLHDDRHRPRRVAPAVDLEQTIQKKP